jgi:hypothetical protein
MAPHNEIKFKNSLLKNVKIVVMREIQMAMQLYALDVRMLEEESII